MSRDPIPTEKESLATIAELLKEILHALKDISRHFGPRGR